ncbi:serine/threonine-protein kinase [Stratiformator vulcanicus]|uniref:Serine/threonine-protein kinase PknB n=1 Tax=Stratiformator vulcanicus TaxID=2527980 RepID=A0A517R7I3_9PLAN|nr:serine/threonine-protein kinase [Stratiformator vulcanicus]QDT39835.1 Serine/threonine-protein kinase PknB [Stratiformator vulcanicus]
MHNVESDSAFTSEESVEADLLDGPPHIPRNDTVVRDDTGSEPSAESDLSGSTETYHNPELDSAIVRRLFPPADGTPAEQLAPDAGGIEIDYFTIEKRIGIGGMGAVFRALDTRLQRIVALKVLSPSLSAEPNAVLRFKNEARAAARLDDSGIARVYHYGEASGLHYIAFEFIEGVNVRDQICKVNRVAPAEAVRIALHITAALKHTAAMGVVHRDIKPSNIILMPDGRAKLVDLGLARKPSTDSYGELTVPGTTLGTFDYISPEQAKDPRTVDVRGDIYSLGCTLYHMLTGEPPYSEGTLLQKLLDHQGKSVPDARVKNSSVPVALSAVLKKMMASQPKQRYATPDDLRFDLERVARAVGLRLDVPVSPLPDRQPHGAFWERNAIWFLAGSVLLLLVAGVEHFATTSDVDSGVENLLAGLEQVGPSTTESDEVSPTSSMGGTSGSSQLVDGSADGATQPVGVAIGSPESTDESPFLLGTDLADGPVPPSPAAPINLPKPPWKAPIAAIGPAEYSGGGSVKPQTLADPPGASGPAAGETGTVLAPRPTETPDGKLVRLISADSGTSTAFRSIESACASAANNDVIELAFDGPAQLGPERRPILIDGKNLTIRAVERSDDGKPYRPVLQFESDSTMTAPTSARIIIRDGSLRLQGVAISATVPTDASAWTLISFPPRGSLRISDASITVRNPSRRPGAVFTPAPRSSTAISTVVALGSAKPPASFSVEIDNSFIRAESALLKTNGNSPGRLDLRNVAIATDGPVMQLTGGVENVAEGAAIDMRLDHTTIVSRGPFLTADAGSVRQSLMPIGVTARDSIFRIGSDQPLISFVGESDVDSLRRLLTWTGENNRYDGPVEFWSIEAPGQMIPSSSRDFDQWVAYWSDSMQSGNEATASTERLPWLNDPALIPPIEMTPDYVAFSISSISPEDIPLIQGTQHSPVGVKPDELPRFLDTSRP